MVRDALLDHVSKVSREALVAILHHIVIRASEEDIDFIRSIINESIPSQYVGHKRQRRIRRRSFQPHHHV